MMRLAAGLAGAGYALRSGGADGADSAFEQGCDLANGAKEIFLPWKKFNKNPSPLYIPSEEAKLTASVIHPAWESCSHGAKLLHARNVHQVLGLGLDDPSRFVLCWTLGGGVRGGTATAMKVAMECDVLVLNLVERVPRVEELLAV